jgi:hemerythrin superfamily protein
MTILDMIREDHDAALALIKKLDPLSEEAHTKKVDGMVRELVLSVKLHAKSEEAALYEGIREAKKDFRDFVLESYNEHECLDLMLDKLLDLEAGDDGELKAALAVVKELIEHHGKEEEEKELFPKLKKAFTADELMAMGSTMQEEKERLRPIIEKEIEAVPVSADSEDSEEPPPTTKLRPDNRSVSH